MTQKEVRQQGQALPEGTVYAWNGEQDCLTFAFPVSDGDTGPPPEPATEAHRLQRALVGAVEPGTPLGWVAVLRFVKRVGAVDLGSFEVVYFSPPVDGLPAETVDGLFRDWVQVKAKAPTPDAPPGGLTIRRLRGVRIGDLQTKAREYMSEATADSVLPAGWGAEAHRRPGRAGKSVLHYALLVQRYTQLCRTSKTPIEDLVADTPGANSAKTIRNQVQKARTKELGLLTDAPGRGRAGGVMTEKCRAVLRDAGLLEDEGATDGKH